VSTYVGVIIGKGWATAPNVTSEFRKISIGSIPYQDLPKVPLLRSLATNKDHNVKLFKLNAGLSKSENSG
jgi:hypothetical protein